VVKAPVAAISLLLLSAPAVHAQNDSVVAVGGAFTFMVPDDSKADHRPGIGVAARLRRGSGLGFSLGLEWFTSEVQTDVAGKPVPLGTMTIRPLMFGVSYSRQFARYALSAGVVGGWSFNSISQTAGQQRIYGDAIGMPDAHVSVGTGWAVRPSVTLWYELGNHFAAAASIGYIFDRPTVTTQGAAGQRRDTVNLNATAISFGFVYGVF
jgi:hypothetical protein